MEECYSISGFNDPMSSLSHLVGTVIFFVLGIFMLWSARHSRKTFLYSLQFVVATLFLLSMSFVYHLLPDDTKARQVLLRLDVAAIFALIASSFTVIHGILFQGWKRTIPIILIWAIAIPGITLRTIFFDSIPSVLGDGIFLLMGWIGLWSAVLLWREFGWPGVRLMFIGGVFYTVGALSNTFDWPIIINRIWGPHETFHLFVLAGLGTHWAFAWNIADGTFQRRYEKEPT